MDKHLEEFWNSCYHYADYLVASEGVNALSINFLELPIPPYLIDVIPEKLPNEGNCTFNYIFDNHPKRRIERVSYSFHSYYYAELIIASSQQGVCALFFVENRKEAVRELANRFVIDYLVEEEKEAHSLLVAYLKGVGVEDSHISIHLKGTDFQIEVWKALLQLKPNQLQSYKDIAGIVARPKASQAVGTAIGRNNISILIPCHRVLRSNGALAGYRWGLLNKLTLLLGEKLLYE